MKGKLQNCRCWKRLKWEREVAIDVGSFWSSDGAVAIYRRKWLEWEREVAIIDFERCESAAVERRRLQKINLVERGCTVVGRSFFLSKEEVSESKREAEEAGQEQFRRERLHDRWGIRLKEDPIREVAEAEVAAGS